MNTWKTSADGAMSQEIQSLRDLLSANGIESEALAAVRAFFQALPEFVTKIDRVLGSKELLATSPTTRIFSPQAIKAVLDQVILYLEGPEFASAPAKREALCIFVCLVLAGKGHMITEHGLNTVHYPVCSQDVVRLRQALKEHNHRHCEPIEITIPAHKSQPQIRATPEELRFGSSFLDEYQQSFAGLPQTDPGITRVDIIPSLRCGHGCLVQLKGDHGTSSNVLIVSGDRNVPIASLLAHLLHLTPANEFDRLNWAHPQFWCSFMARGW